MVLSILKSLNNCKALEGDHPDRRFVGESECIINHHGIGVSALRHKDSKRHYFLFSDVVVLAKRTKTAFNAKEIFFLNATKIEESAVAYSITLITQQRTVVVILPSIGQFTELETQLKLLIKNSTTTSAVFGGDLAELVVRDNTNGIPAPLLALSDALLPVIHTQGIFREAGCKQNIDELQRAFNEGRWQKLNLVAEFEVHTVAAVYNLLLFLITITGIQIILFFTARTTFPFQLSRPVLATWRIERHS